MKGARRFWNSRFGARIIGAVLLGLLPAHAHASLAEIAGVPGLIGEGGYGSAAIDPAHDIAFFGSSTSVTGDIAKYQLQDALHPFAVIGATAPFAFVSNFTAAAFDQTTGFGFFASSSAFSGIAIEKVPLTAAAVPPTSSKTVFAAGAPSIGTEVLDTANQFGYFGTFSSPSQVLKVRLADLAVIDTLTLPSGLENLSASLIDTTGGFAYFGSSTTVGAVAKIKLSDFTIAGTLTFNSGEGGVASAIIDPIHQLAYFGTHDSPGKIVQVSLSGLTRVGAITLPSGSNDLTSAVADLGRNFAYFGTNTVPGIVVPVYLPSFNPRTGLTLASRHDFLRSGVLDTANHYAYFGTYTTPALAVQIDLLAGPPDILLQPNNAQVHPGETAFFAITADGRNLSYQWQKNGANIAGATAAAYSQVVTTADDGASFRCVITGANGSVTSNSAVLTIIPIIRAYPNPWRVDRHAGVNITFDGLLPNSTIKIFNLALHWAKTIAAPAGGTATWDLSNDNGEKVASGYYFYLVKTSNDKQTVDGKLAIIR